MDTKALRQKILDLAIRGKLVPQDPNDEPASVLLERIREQKKQMVKEGKLKAKDIKNDSVIFIGEDNLHYEKFTDGNIKCIEDEIPFELPDGWSWARLGSIANIVTGRLDANAQTPDGEYPFFTCGEEVFKTDTYAFDCNAILLGGNNATGDFKMHKFSGKFNAYQRVYVITTFPEIDVDYLYNHIRFYLPKLQSQSIGSQTRYLKLGMITDLLVALPTFREQKLVSSSCNKYLNYCTEIASEKDDLKKYIKSAKSKILDLAIRGKLVPQNPDDEPASVLLERIRAEKEELIKQGKIKRDKKESVIFKGEDNSYYEKIGDKAENINTEIPFDLPDDWEFVRLKEIWELISGRDLSPSEYNADGAGIPYITGASNFINGKVELVRWTTSPQVLTEVGDLLLTCKGTIGEMAFNDFGPAHIARQIMAIRNIYGLNAKYLALCMDFYMYKIKDAAKGLIPGISREDILNLILPIPPEQHQTQVVHQVEKINRILSSIEKSLS